MATKKILGLDLGTNSIGWAVVNAETTDKGLQPIGIAMQAVALFLWMLHCKVTLRAEIAFLKQPTELLHAVFVDYSSVVLCAVSVSIEC